MQVQKYKIGELVTSGFDTVRDLYIVEIEKGISYYFTLPQLLRMGATPLIESEPREIVKLDYRFDGAATEADLTVHEHKINELVDAVNALQKGK